MIKQIFQYNIIQCDLQGTGNIQIGLRPCIVVSNNICNEFSPTITVVPLTTRRKNNLITHCDIFTAPQHSIALCEQISTINKSQIREKLGTLTMDEIQKVKNCIKIQLNLGEDYETSK